jgi:two-component system, chemotaxis family, chemotaxis protein CheY
MPKLLLVDDDRFVRTILKDILSEHGYEFIEAANGREALERVRDDNPDLVLLDLFMPEMSGIEALSRIRELKPETGVIVISSLGSDTLVKQALDAGARAFIVKPFHPLEIASTVSKALEARQ